MKGNLSTDPCKYIWK